MHCKDVAHHSSTGRLLEAPGSSTTVPKYCGSFLPLLPSGCFAGAPDPDACITYQHSALQSRHHAKHAAKSLASLALSLL